MQNSIQRGKPINASAHIALNHPQYASIVFDSQCPGVSASIPPAQEIDAGCRNIISDHHAWCNASSGRRMSQPCVFGDVLHQLAYVPTFKGKRFAEKMAMVDKEAMGRTQYCYTHAQQCPIMRSVDIDMSGLPCPDNSRANLKRKYEEGDTSSVYAVWAKKHRILQTPVLVIENVVEPRNDSVSLLGTNPSITSEMGPGGGGGWDEPWTAD